jgi:uncharacterized membrane protein (UPF0182 family)
MANCSVQSLSGLQHLAETRRFKVTPENQYLILFLSSLSYSHSSSRIICIYVYVCVSVQAWFLDQFGVLHDGKKPYPGAILTCMFSSLPFRIVMAIDSIMFNVWFLVFGFCL